MPRLGLHVHQNNRRADILDWYRRLQPSAVLFLSVDDGFVRELKAVSPGTKVIGRLVVNTSEQQLSGSGAKSFVNRLEGKVVEHPTVDYWIGYNEAFDIPSEIGRYADFEIDRMKMLERHGKKALIGGFSQGAPEITDSGATWAKFKPALEYALAKGHALHLHEYAGPYVGYGVNTPDGLNQWDHAARRVNGVSTDPSVWVSPSLDGWHTLRYRMVYRLFATWGLGALPLYITEFGTDNINLRPGGQGTGYKDWVGTEWERVPGLGDFSGQCHWYMRQVSHDSFVKGVVLFGYDGSSLGWGSFDIADDPVARDRILQTQAILPVGHFGAPAPPTPQPQPPTPPTPQPELPVNNVEVIIWSEVDKAHTLRGLPYTPSHALVAAAKIPEGVLLPTTDEITVNAGGSRYIAQRFQVSDTGQVVVIYFREGVWNKPFRITGAVPKA